MTPSFETLCEVVDGTWPAAQYQRLGPWTLRRGDGGGQRVSAATATAAFSDSDLAQAEQAMQAMGQPRLFQVRTGDEKLDATLEANGYRIVDPVNYWVAPCANVGSQTPPPVTAFAVWPALAIQCELWDDGGIDTARRNVMTRANGPKTTVFGRTQDRAAGSAFVAIHKGTAMLHALEVAPALRRHGLARWMMRKAAIWAYENGADHISVLCTQANTGANALYAGLGMTQVGTYHYRRHPEDF